MPATFNRLKDWIAETLLYEDLNAEFDNIFNNFDPLGIGSYSANVSQYGQVTSPLDGGGNPSLPNSLAGELERLRYQILAIMGSDATNWYDSPNATLSGLSSIIFTNSVPNSRVESISSDSYVNILRPSGASLSVTLRASVNPITYFIKGVRYTLNTDVSLSGMSPAITSLNTATFNDAALSGTHASTYAGEHDTVMTLSGVGVSLAAQAGVNQAYKVVHSGTTEYFTGYYNATGTKIEKAMRGKFFLNSGAASSRTIISNGDVITLQKLAYIFLKNDGTLTLTYNNPVYSFTQPSAPVTGDYWFNLDTTNWSVYSPLGYVDANAVYIGQVVNDGTACIAARSVEPFRIYSTLNEMDIEVTPGGGSLRTKLLQSSLAVYGATFYYGSNAQLWNVIEGGGVLAAAQTYYAYVKETGDFILSTIAPHDRRGDLGGYYHPSHSWRAVGYATTSASLFTSTSLVSLFLTNEKYFNPIGYIQTRDLADGSVTQVKRAALGQQISANCATFSTTSGTAVDITNLSITITTTGRPVFLSLLNDPTAGDGQITVNRTGVNAVGFIYFVRTATNVARHRFETSATGATAVALSVPAGSFTAIDVPAAGTYTYKVQGATNASATLALNWIQLLAYEL